MLVYVLRLKIAKNFQLNGNCGFQRPHNFLKIEHSGKIRAATFKMDLEICWMSETLCSADNSSYSYESMRNKSAPPEILNSRPT
jgi:hypothetical protein